MINQIHSKITPPAIMKTVFLLLCCSQYILAQNRVAKVQESPPPVPWGGPYQDSVRVTLSCETPGAQIHYILLDRPNTSKEVPTMASPLYTGPILITRDSDLLTKAFKEGMEPSILRKVKYLFESPVGLIRVDEIYYTGINIPTYSINGSEIRPNGGVLPAVVARSNALSINL